MKLPANYRPSLSTMGPLLVSTMDTMMTDWRREDDTSSECLLRIATEHEDHRFLEWASDVVDATNCGMKNVPPYRVRRRLKNKAARAARRRNRKNK